MKPRYIISVSVKDSSLPTSQKFYAKGDSHFSTTTYTTAQGNRRTVYSIITSDIEKAYQWQNWTNQRLAKRGVEKSEISTDGRTFVGRLVRSKSGYRYSLPAEVSKPVYIPYKDKRTTVDLFLRRVEFEANNRHTSGKKKGK